MILDELLLRPLLAGLAVALAAGPLGAFVVWRRMAYFGEALANAALLGAILALLLDINLVLGVLVFTGLLALALAGLERRATLPLDTVLSLLAHGALAFGLLALSTMDRMRVDLMGYLFGDVLAVGSLDLLLIALVAALVLLVLVWHWRPLLSATVHPDLAAIEGVRVGRMRLLLNLLVAGMIAVGMKVVGILLIIALLVIPAAAARRLASSPERMALLAALIGAGSVAAGLQLSLGLDAPAGPAITAACVLAFVLAQLVGAMRGQES